MVIMTGLQVWRLECTPHTFLRAFNYETQVAWVAWRFWSSTWKLLRIWQPRAWCRERFTIRLTSMAHASVCCWDMALSMSSRTFCKRWPFQQGWLFKGSWPRTSSLWRTCTPSLRKPRRTNWSVRRRRLWKKLATSCWNPSWTPWMLFQRRTCLRLHQLVTSIQTVMANAVCFQIRILAKKSTLWRVHHVPIGQVWEHRLHWPGRQCCHLLWSCRWWSAVVLVFSSTNALETLGPQSFKSTSQVSGLQIVWFLPGQKSMWFQTCWPSLTPWPSAWPWPGHAAPITLTHTDTLTHRHIHIHIYIYTDPLNWSPLLFETCLLTSRFDDHTLWLWFSIVTYCNVNVSIFLHIFVLAAFEHNPVQSKIVQIKCINW